MQRLIDWWYGVGDTKDNEREMKRAQARLNTQRLRLEQRVEQCVADARAALKRGDRQSASIHVKRKLALEKQLVEVEQLALNVEMSQLQVDQTRATQATVTGYKAARDEMQRAQRRLQSEGDLDDLLDELGTLAADSQHAVDTLSDPDLFGNASAAHEVYALNLEMTDEDFERALGIEIEEKEEEERVEKQQEARRGGGGDSLAPLIALPSPPLTVVVAEEKPIDEPQRQRRVDTC